MVQLPGHLGEHALRPWMSCSPRLHILVDLCVAITALNGESSFGYTFHMLFAGCRGVAHAQIVLDNANAYPSTIAITSRRHPRQLLRERIVEPRARTMRWHQYACYLHVFFGLPPILLLVDISIRPQSVCFGTLRICLSLTPRGCVSAELAATSSG